MKLPSINFILENLINTLKRFPLVIATAIASTLLSMYSIELEDNSKQEVLIKIIMTLSLGLPLFFATTIFAESTQKIMYQWLSAVTGIALLGVFYFTTAIYIEDAGKYAYRYALWLISFHLLVAFAAFSLYKCVEAFWQYNKNLFLRFLYAVLYSAVLFLGLAGAILAVAELFNINISWKRYWQLFVFISCFFNTLFFLGGIPKNLDHFISNHEYSKGLKIFTQYVLIPLVTIYLIILYTYLGKIILENTLPKGWVANLIIAFSVAGIFSLLLIYPIKDNEGNAWINIFSRFYYFSLVPMIALLFVAIARRISDYGITIERYLVSSLGVWLAFITLYFIFSRRKNIIVIPFSLSILFLGISIGPWGAFEISEKNQLRRLEKLLQENNLLQDGKIIPLNITEANQLPNKSLYQIGSILRYLNDNHSLNGIKKYLDTNNKLVKEIYHDSTNRYEKLQILRQYTGIPFKEYEIYPEEKNTGNHYNFYTEKNNEAVVITGYDTMYNFYAYKNDNKTDIDTSFIAYIENNEVCFYQKGKLKVSENLTSYCLSLKKYHSIKSNNYGSYFLPKSLQNTTSQDSSIYNLIIHHIQFYENNDTITLNNVEGYLLLN